MKLLTWLFDRADRYAARSTWRDFALVKICLFSMGVLMGLLVPVRKKKWTALAAGLAFIPTYVILVCRFLPFLLDREDEDWEDEPEEGSFCGEIPNEHPVQE